MGDYIIGRLKRDLADSLNPKGMTVGMPKAKVDVSHLEYVLNLAEIALKNKALMAQAADHLTNWLDMDLCSCDETHHCGRSQVTNTRNQLIESSKGC